MNFRRPMLLPKPFEDERQKLPFDTLSGVGHDAFHVIVDSANAQCNGTSAGCEFHGIVQKVHQNLLQPVGIRHERRYGFGYVRVQLN